MDFDPNVLLIAPLIFLIAMLYSAVGHGGASGYLAILSFFAFSPDEMASTALTLNILVAGLAFITFHQARYFSWRLTWPFIVTSIPAAFAGGRLAVPHETYYLVLAVVLLFAAFRLGWRLPEGEAGEIRDVPPDQQVAPIAALSAGGGIGLLSGMVGVGGGIFLSPLMLLMRWADVRHTAATAALFIVVNALAGLAGRYSRDALIIGDLLPLLVAGFLGGVVGSWLGARSMTGQRLRQVLVLVLLVAAVKLVLLSF